MKKSLVIASAIIVLIVVICIIMVVPLMSPGKVTDLELKEYNGTTLSPISLFRENSISGPQTVELSQYRLRIDGLVKNPASYTYEQVLTLFQSEKRLTTLSCVEGWDVTVLWEGVRVRDILNDSQLQNSGNTVIFHSVDGYTTSFPIENVINNNYLLAYKVNNLILPQERGYPLALVADGKWGYKWARWVDKITVTNDPSYRGYWESRGYAQDGDLNKSFYD